MLLKRLSVNIYAGTEEKEQLIEFEELFCVIMLTISLMAGHKDQRAFNEGGIQKSTIARTTAVTWTRVWTKSFQAAAEQG